MALNYQDICQLIGLEAYWKNGHPDHKAIQQRVTKWFADHFSEDFRMGNPWQQLGNTLFVGEGNFSFSASIAAVNPPVISHITATSFEKAKDVTKQSFKNISLLKRLGANILYNIDATKLENHFPNQKFDTIVFQFPHTGSREPIYNRNPNFILVRRFLKSAAAHLTRDGKVIITLVDNSYYDGAFQLEEAANETGFNLSVVHPFDPHDFPDYSHTNTSDEKSGAENHTRFKTWIFTLKENV